MRTTIKRLQQGIFAAASSSNRDAGSGAGTGNLPLKSLGYLTGSNLGSYSTANSSTFTDITGSSFLIQINRPTVCLYYVTINTHGVTTSANPQTYARGNIVGFDTTQVMGGITDSVWYFPVTGALLPGTYTVKVQVATDSTLTTVFVDQLTHQFFDVGA